VAACFALSGFAALVYQTAWLRQLALVFGTSELAAAAVLAAYMGGLALGAAVAGRYIERVAQPVWVYGLLEAGVAITALSVPWLLARAADLQVAWLGGRPAPPDAGALQLAFQLAAAFAVLCAPTALMGATLPLLARHAVRGDRELLPRVALLYAANTAGAVAGTLATGFVLLPDLGLRGAVSVGIASNLAVLAIAVAIARRAGAVAEPAARAAAAAAPARERIHWILPLALASGAVAFGYELVWTRLLSHVLGGSLQAFATMLAAFLTGIALGGGLAGRLAADRAPAARAFGLAQAGTAALSLLVYALLSRVVPESRAAPALAAYAFALLLPATLCIGASFPLAVRVLAPDAAAAGRASARVYAWNTLGAIAGALAAGLFAIPALGFEGAIRLAASANLVLAAAALAAGGARGAALAACAALVGVVLLVHPGRPDALVTRAGIARAPLADPTEVFYAVGRTATVLALASDGYFYLRSNGLPEATVASRGAPPSAQPEKWLGALPFAARPDARSLLLIGLGGGVTLEGVPETVEAIDVIEIEPEMIAANRALAARRAADPLADPRVRIAVNDARNALSRTTARWDAIVSQPSHPWTAGSAQLFTREFARIARGHLTPSGVFAQWMNAELVTAPLLASLAATLRAEFPHVRMYQPSALVLVFLASESPLEPEVSVALTGRPLMDAPTHYGRLGIHAPEDLLAALALDTDGVAALAGGAPPIADDRNLLATGSRPAADGLAPADLEALLLPHDPLLDPAGPVYARIGYALDPAYLAARLVAARQVERARRFAEILPEAADAAIARGVIAQARGDREAARAAFRAALAADPGSQSARYLLLRDSLHQLAAPDLDPELEALLAGLTGSALAVAAGWPHLLARDLDTLAELDPALARARPTDAWYPEAVRLRAEWRLHAAEDAAALAGEAKALIDLALPHFHDRDLLLLRAAAAIAMRDADVLVESGRHVVADIERELAALSRDGVALPTHERDVLRHNLAALAEQLAGPLCRDHPRAEAVLRRARSLLAELEPTGAARG
jgi:spermidine synthase